MEILDRVLPNYSQTSHGRGPCAGDSWASLKPHSPTNYPNSPLLHDLGTVDAELLAEFYASVDLVRETLDNWHATDYPLDGYNAWNALMHSVQRSLRAGQLEIQRLCPDRPFDAAAPASGTLLSRSERSLSIADGTRKAFLDRFEAAGGKLQVSNPFGLRKTGGQP